MNRNPLIYSLFFIMSIITACGNKNQLEEVLMFADENRNELEKVLEYYEQDSLKKRAAEFLIQNIGNKRYFAGKQLEGYNQLFHLYDSLRCSENIIDGDPPAILKLWKELKKKYGVPNYKQLETKWDCQELTADFLIDNIECAFEAWENTPTKWHCNFEQFCEYILPHRVGQEKPEPYRRKYYERYRGIRDTIGTDSLLMVNMNDQFFWKEHFRNSDLMWEYPFDLSVSQMETGRRGSCRHMSLYCAQTMRAMGLPVAIDHVPRWGNRSKGHSWNVLIHPDGSIYPFDSFGRDSLKFAYKPAKIFRHMYSSNWLPSELPNTKDVPKELLLPNEMDVTHHYGKTFDITIECTYPYKRKGQKHHGLICVFDNKAWQPIWWGKIDDGKMKFENMMGDICYMAAYFDNGDIIPACEPFILTKEGKLIKLQQGIDKPADMTLLRKYPRFERMEMHAMNLRRSRIEASNDMNFNETTLLFDMLNTPHDVNDSLVYKKKKFRYVRWKIVDYRTGELAEIEFYGKQSLNDPEKKLTGTIIGTPEPTKNTQHPYHHAMDGDPATFFSKPKKMLGYVGLDLGKGNEAYITRVHFHPRSDTNYILIGDTYELCYWNKKHWVSAGTQVATTHELMFKNVPQGTFYILHNLTKGKEERIFTYENGKQVWW